MVEIRTLLILNNNETLISRLIAFRNKLRVLMNFGTHFWGKRLNEIQANIQHSSFLCLVVFVLYFYKPFREILLVLVLLGDL
jgi:hypothetical protein